MLQKLRWHAQGTDSADSASRWISLSWLAAIIGGVYILAARLSLSLLTPDGVAVFWPAAGVASGALIAFGPPARWAVVAGTMVGTVLANLLGDRNLSSSLVFAVCNAGEALLAAYLIQRFFASPFSLDRLRHVLGMLAAAIVATAISGVGGTLGFVLFHGGATSTLAIWQEWFASDALGIIAIAPLIIGLASATREPPARGETVEGLVALAWLIVLCVVVTALPPEPWTTVVPVALLFPVLLWISARCQPVFAAAAAFIVTLAIVWTTTIGIGQFGDASLPIAERVFAARAGILAVALCAYVLAALFAERRQHEVVLAESEARLQEALTAGAVTTFVWDSGTASSQRSANAAQVLGFDPNQSLTPNNFLSRVHPGDRERFKALVRGVNSRRPAYSITFRFKRADGREVWLEETAKAEFDGIGRLMRLKGLTLDVTARKTYEDEQKLLIAAREGAAGTHRGSGKGHAPSQRIARGVRWSTRFAHRIYGKYPYTPQPASLERR
jgi:PAS domain S-box-containing protein